MIWYLFVFDILVIDVLDNTIYNVYFFFLIFSFCNC